MPFEDLLTTIGISFLEKTCCGLLYLELEYVLTKLSMIIKLTVLLLKANAVLFGFPWMLTFAIKMHAVRQGKFGFST